MFSSLFSKSIFAETDFLRLYVALFILLFLLTEVMQDLPRDKQADFSREYSLNSDTSDSLRIYTHTFTIYSFDPHVINLLISL